MAQKFGKQSDLVAAGGAGNGSARQTHLECFAVGRGGEFGENEGGMLRRLCRASVTLLWFGKPRREGGILDAALLGENWRAEAAGLEGVEDFALVLGGVTGATGAVTLDDWTGRRVDRCFHRPRAYLNPAVLG